MYNFVTLYQLCSNNHPETSYTTLERFGYINRLPNFYYPVFGEVLIIKSLHEPVNRSTILFYSAHSYKSHF